MNFPGGDLTLRDIVQSPLFKLASNGLVAILIAAAGYAIGYVYSVRIEVDEIKKDRAARINLTDSRLRSIDQTLLTFSSMPADIKALERQVDRMAGVLEVLQRDRLAFGGEGVDPGGNVAAPPRFLSTTIN